jgi:tetratricopeptide (TPR) repeat protein
MPDTEKHPELFLTALEAALEHFGDDDWLEGQSALAAPYFLGNFAETRAAAAVRCLLTSAAQPLEPEARALLEVSFFKRDWDKNINGVALQLHMSRAAYYRHRAQALRDLADQVLVLASPALRLEAIPAAQPLIGRADQEATLVLSLTQGGTAAIVGMSGSGKSALAATVCRALTQTGRAAFWFTIRPGGLSDRLEAFVFALAYFLHTQGAGSTWRQWVADAGAISRARALSMLRHDLSACSPAPLLCIDDVHVLQPDDEDQASLLHLIEELRVSAPVLCVGQHIALDAGVIVALPLLDEAQTRGLLAELGLTDAPPEMLATVFGLTRGNPASIRLLAALGRDHATLGAALGTGITAAGPAPLLEAVFDRLWLRLPAEIRGVYAGLAIYDNGAPDDVFRETAGLITNDRLIERVGDRVLRLPSAIRHGILRRMTPDERAAQHVLAASAFETRGAYTEAAGHLIGAKQNALAVSMWFAHRKRETALGNAASALALFDAVNSADLPTDDLRRMLAILRAEICTMLGKSEQAEAALRGAAWPAGVTQTTYRDVLMGNIHETRGELEAAHAVYEQGYARFALLGLREGTQLSMARAYLYLRQRDIGEARQYALRARVEAENLQAAVALESGDFAAARAHAISALSQVEALDGDGEMVRVSLHERLGRLAWQTGDTITALEHLGKARDISLRRGDVVQAAYMQLNLSAAHIVAGEYEQALACCEEGLPTAEAMKHGYLLAVLNVNAAEACYFLGRIDDAERHAVRALAQEEETNAPYTFTMLGLVARARKSWTQAEANLRFAVDAALRISDPYAEACAWRWLGHVFQDQALAPQAADAFGRARARFVAIGLEKEAEATPG